MTPTRNADYKIHRDTSKQWRQLLAVMAQEMVSGEPYDGCDDFSHRVGVRYADHSLLPECTSLEELEAAINARWQLMDWGWINLTDQGKSLLIVHHGAGNGQLPGDAFGDDSDGWIPGFLSGVYQQWLASIGAGERLRVKPVAPIDEFGTIEFDLSR